MNRSMPYCSLLLFSSLATAQEQAPPPAATQSDFHEITKDVIAAAGYRWLAPAEATGVTGFAVGAFGSYVPVSGSAYQNFTGQDVNELGVVGAVAQKGLPFGFDLGLQYAYLPREGVSQFGAQLQYAILEGGIATPAIALRSGYTQLTNVNHPALITYNVDVAVSKGFGNLTPYGSIGYLHGRFDTYDDVPGIEQESIGMLRLVAGLRVSFGLFDITPEYSLVGSASVLSLRLGFSI